MFSNIAVCPNCGEMPEKHSDGYKRVGLGAECPLDIASARQAIAFAAALRVHAPKVPDALKG